MADLDVIIAGAGVVGLAVGRALARRGLAVAIAEREDAFGTGVSSRNSEVIHAGIYYRPGSLKAQFCVRGRELLYAYCRENDVEHKQCGKLIVAADEAEFQRLTAIRDNAAAIGTPLLLLDAAGVAELEPDIIARGALLSPATGIVDSHGLMMQLLTDFEAAGGILALTSPVERVKCVNGEWRVHLPDGAITTRWFINCAGLHATEVALAVDEIDARQVPVTRYARGLYVRASPSIKPSRLIYPLPEPGGLGVHATIDLAGTTKFGPDVEWIEDIDYAIDESRIESFRGSIAKYWPGVAEAELTPDYTGVRPKIAKEGEGDADFTILGPQTLNVANQIHLFGIESPGLTASLAIGDYVTVMLSPTSS